MESDSRGFFLLIFLGVTIIYQLTFYSIAAACQFDLLTDAAGSSNFVLLVWLSFGMGKQANNDLSENPRNLILSTLVSVWGVRLGSFLFARVAVRGKDARFDQMRSRPLAFLGFWVFQMLWVYVCSMPVLLANTVNPATRSGGDSYAPQKFGSVTDVLGVVLAGSSLLLEIVADLQKSRYNSPSRLEDRRMPVHTGVWAWSRHPNYCGEIGFWLGVWLLSISAHWGIPASGAAGGAEELDSAWPAGLVSPLFSFILLMGVSGAPLGEARYNQLFGDNPEYWCWKHQTSPLLPVPPAFYRCLPRGAVRRWLCLDFWQEPADPSQRRLQQAADHETR